MGVGVRVRVNPIPPGHPTGNLPKATGSRTANLPKATGSRTGNLPKATLGEKRGGFGSRSGLGSLPYSIGAKERLRVIDRVTLRVGDRVDLTVTFLL